MNEAETAARLSLAQVREKLIGIPCGGALLMAFSWRTELSI